MREGRRSRPTYLKSCVAYAENALHCKLFSTEPNRKDPMSNDSSGDFLRATTWAEYVGQTALKERLRIHIQAANADERPLDHCLFAAPPGYGKTTLSGIIATEMGMDFRSLTMPVQPRVIASLLAGWDGGVLLLDEFHRAPSQQQQDLLTLALDGYLQVTSGRRIYHDYLTIILATTKAEKIDAAVADRFAINPRFADYTDADMAQIVTNMGRKVDITFPKAMALALGRASGGAPRVARSLVLAARDLKRTGHKLTVESVLNLTGMAADGLSPNHIAYLRSLRDLGGLAGLQTLSSMLRLHPSVLQDLERLLVERRMITLQPNGRELTDRGHLKLSTDQSKRGRA